MIGVFFNSVSFSDLNRSLVALSQARGFQAGFLASQKKNPFKSTDSAAASASDAARLRQRAENLMRKKIGIQNARNDLESVIDTLETAKVKLGEMKEVAKLVQNASAESRGALAQEFDNLYTEYNSIVDGAAAPGRNLIGDVFRTSWLPDDISYQTNESQSSRRTVNGEYLGADYFITDSADGNLWVADTFGATLSKYADYPNTSTADESVGALTINSFDRATGAITFTTSGGGTVNGTLQRGGVAVLQSWLYDNFSTTSGGDAAISDIDAAISKIEIAQLGFKTHFSTADSRVKVVDKNIELLSSDATQIEVNLFGKQIEEQTLKAARDAFQRQQQQSILSGRGSADLLSALFNL